jgi:hypothetical protein
VARIAGTRTSVEPPPGFAPADRFPGFEDPAREASIAVTELPVPLASIAADLASDRLEANGWAVLAAGPRPGGGWEARIRADEWSGAVWKWIVALGDDQRSATVVATAPVGDEALADQITAALATATFDPSPPASAFEGLPFAVDELDGLRVAARTTHLALLTEGGSIGKAPGEPMLTVAALPAEPDDRGAFARDRLKDLGQVHGLQELDAVDVALASGLVGLEIVADGLLGPDAVPVKVYQLVADQEGLPLRFVVVGVVDARRSIDPFRRVARTLRP